MNMPDALMDRTECIAARLDSVSNVRDVARKVFECQFSWFDRSDPLVVEVAFPQAHILYVCSAASGNGENTFIDSRFYFDSSQMWIGSMQVASSYRLRGFGRQLVRAAEATAGALGLEEVSVLPLPSSIAFWQKIGYVPDPRSARVLRKSCRSSGLAMTDSVSGACPDGFNDRTIVRATR